MPSRNPRVWLTISDEERQRLFQVWAELRNPGRRRTPLYIGQRLTFNKWLARIALGEAARLAQELAESE